MLALAHLWNSLLRKHIGYKGALQITSEIGQTLFNSTKGVIAGNSFNRESLVPIINSEWTFDLLPTEKKTGLDARTEKSVAQNRGAILRKNVNELSQIENYLVTTALPNLLKSLKN